MGLVDCWIDGRRSDVRSLNGVGEHRHLQNFEKGSGGVAEGATGCVDEAHFAFDGEL